MKKKVFGQKLSRERDTRRALFRSLTRAIVSNGKIVTTKAKAKAVRPLVEKVITLGRKQDLSSRRKVMSLLANDLETTNLIFDKIANSFNRSSGFTRVVNLPSRRGDAAEMVRFEWSQEIITKVKEEKIKEPKAKKSLKDRILKRPDTKAKEDTKKPESK